MELAGSAHLTKLFPIFSNYITDRANVYFKKPYRHRAQTMFSDINYKEKKEWYNDECKNKHDLYISSLYAFNLTKNNETRKIMLQRKKDYKYYCRTCKVKYNREQGRKLRELKKKRPREFWNTFKRKSPDETSEISLQEFYDHFRSLASNTNTHENDDIREFLNSFETDNIDSTCTYEELDEPITQLEILKMPQNS